MGYTPNIRFKGFTDAWEQRKLSEIADKVTEKNRNNYFSEPFTNSAELGIISQKDYFDREVVNQENLDGYYIVKKDDFVYNPRISVTAPVGPINRNRLGRNGVMSPLYTVFRTHEIDNLYLEFYFKTTSWHGFMKHNGDSGARFDRFTISSTQFMEMPIPCPDKEEQRKIGKYFDELDHLITLHQRKCDEIIELKKYMLQKMFPQNNQKVPELRFVGFTGDWERHKFSNIVMEKLTNGVMNQQSDFQTDVKHINVINMYVFDKIHVEDLTYSSCDNIAVEKCNVEVGDIFLTRSSLKPEGIAEPNVLLDDGCFVFDDHLIRMKVNKEKYDPLFTKILLSTKPVKKQFIAKSKQNAFTTIGQEDIAESEGLFPSLSEQQEIGKYFSNIDNLITLHQHKCDALKEIKKFMLQNMFP